MGKHYPKPQKGKSKYADQLKKGDVLSTGAIVLDASRGVKTPSGKIDIDLKYPSGKTIRSTWNKKTVISLKNEGEDTMKIKMSELKDMILEVLQEEEDTTNVEETLEPVSPASGNPTKRVKAKKRDQILASEGQVEALVRKMVQEELKFVMHNEIPGGLSRKRAKKRIAQKGSAKTNSTV